MSFESDDQFEVPDLLTQVNQINTENQNRRRNKITYTLKNKKFKKQ